MTEISRNLETSQLTTHLDMSEIEINHQAYKCLAYCDKRSLMSHMSLLSDAISRFGIKYNLWNPNSILNQNQNVSISIRLFINNPDFLFKPKKSYKSFQGRILELFKSNKDSGPKDLNIEDKLKYLFAGKEQEQNEIDFSPYIDYICDIKRNRPDLKNILSTIVYDIIK